MADPDAANELQCAHKKQLYLQQQGRRPAVVVGATNTELRDESLDAEMMKKL